MYCLASAAFHVRIPDISAPPTFHVRHDPRGGLDPGSVHGVLGEFRDVVKHRIDDRLLYVHVTTLRLMVHLPQDLCLNRVEVTISAEVLALLHVDVLIFVHGCGNSGELVTSTRPLPSIFWAAATF